MNTLPLCVDSTPPCVSSSPSPATCPAPANLSSPCGTGLLTCVRCMTGLQTCPRRVGQTIVFCGLPAPQALSSVSRSYDPHQHTTPPASKTRYTTNSYEVGLLSPLLSLVFGSPIVLPPETQLNENIF